MTRKEEAADCRRKASSILNGQVTGCLVLPDFWTAVRQSYTRLAEALELERQVRDVVVGDRRAA